MIDLKKFYLQRWLQELKNLYLLMGGFHDFFLIEVRGKSMRIESTDGREYPLSTPLLFSGVGNVLYFVAVKKLNEKEYLLSFGIDKPNADLESLKRGTKTIAVRKGQYIKLKQEWQYQQSLKEREEKHNQLFSTQFKNWAKNRAKDIRDTKQSDIIVGLFIAIMFFLLGKSC